MQVEQRQKIDAIEALESERGELTPEALVTAAKSVDHPWHGDFEWDDAKASHAYRIEQARRIIRNVRVMVQVHERVVRVPKYVRDPERHVDEQGYRSVAKLRDDEDMKREAIVSEFARAASALRRARDIADYFGVKGEVDETLQRIQSVQQQVEIQQ